MGLVVRRTYSQGYFAGPIRRIYSNDARLRIRRILAVTRFVLRQESVFSQALTREIASQGRALQQRALVSRLVVLIFIAPNVRRPEYSSPPINSVPMRDGTHCCSSPRRFHGSGN